MQQLDPEATVEVEQSAPVSRHRGSDCLERQVSERRNLGEFGRTWKLGAEIRLAEQFQFLYAEWSRVLMQ